MPSEANIIVEDIEFLHHGERPLLLTLYRRAMARFRWSLIFMAVPGTRGSGLSAPNATRSWPNKGSPRRRLIFVMRRTVIQAR
jgi:hypothetical protein